MQARRAAGRDCNAGLVAFGRRAAGGFLSGPAASRRSRPLCSGFAAVTVPPLHWQPARPPRRRRLKTGAVGGRAVRGTASWGGWVGASQGCRVPCARSRLQAHRVANRRLVFLYHRYPPGVPPRISRERRHGRRHRTLATPMLLSTRLPGRTKSLFRSKSSWHRPPLVVSGSASALN